MVASLSAEEQQILKDTLTEGWWGDCEHQFLKIGARPIERNIETVVCYGYCVNDAYKAGHFRGRIVSQLFSGVYRKLCVLKHNNVGEVISHCHDWWGDGTGDITFDRYDWCMAFHDWARDL